MLLLEPRQNTSLLVRLMLEEVWTVLVVLEVTAETDIGCDAEVRLRKQIQTCPAETRRRPRHRRALRGAQATATGQRLKEI